MVLAEKVLNLALERDSWHILKVIGSDSCPKMKGRKGGVRALVEKGLKTPEKPNGRPVQPVYCIKHTLEIVCKKFFTLLDGKESGPTSRPGPIGQRVTQGHVHETDIKNFTPVPCCLPEIPDDVVQGFSKDDRVFYKLCILMAVGPSYITDKEPNLPFIVIGPHHEAR